MDPIYAISTPRFVYLALIIVYLRKLNLKARLPVTASDTQLPAESCVRMNPEVAPARPCKWGRLRLSVVTASCATGTSIVKTAFRKLEETGTGTWGAALLRHIRVR